MENYPIRKCKNCDKELIPLLTSYAECDCNNNMIGLTFINIGKYTVYYKKSNDNPFQIKYQSLSASLTKYEVKKIFQFYDINKNNQQQAEQVGLCKIYFDIHDIFYIERTDIIGIMKSFVFDTIDFKTLKSFWSQFFY